ncbi:MAG: hypothetical protein Q8K26_02760, partial [Candidatus Gracilibacteria bacterium]|nr:hypothetical protein [Candidatus Gracilibacteria bacterium]
LDSVAPTTTSIISPTDGAYYNTGTINLMWDPVTDTGAGLSSTPYNYAVSTDSNFTSIIASGSTSFTGTVLTLSDDTYFAKIQSQDLVGNISTSSVISFTIDTTSPLEPTNILVNGGNIINADTHSNVSITGSGEISESGSIVEYAIFDSASGSVTGTGLIDANGSFLFSHVDVSTLADGILTCNFHIIDQAGNSGNSIAVTIGKSVVLAAGSITFLSGAYSHTSTTDVLLSVAKPVSYIISGTGITESITGTLASSGTIVIPVTLSPTNGIKNIQTTFTDGAGVETTAMASIILDIPNIVDITIPSSDVYVTGSVVFSGVLATGSTVFSGTEMVSITDAANSTDRVSLSLSGL